MQALWFLRESKKWDTSVIVVAIATVIVIVTVTATVGCWDCSCCFLVSVATDHCSCIHANITALEKLWIYIEICGTQSFTCFITLSYWSRVRIQWTTLAPGGVEIYRPHITSGSKSCRFGQCLLLLGLALVLSAKPNGFAVRGCSLFLVVDRCPRRWLPKAAVVGGSTVVACVKFASLAPHD